MRILQFRREAAYLYDAVVLYAGALARVLREGKDPKDGGAVVGKILGKSYKR